MAEPSVATKVDKKAKKEDKKTKKEDKNDASKTSIVKVADLSSFNRVHIGESEKDNLKIALVATYLSTDLFFTKDNKGISILSYLLVRVLMFVFLQRC